MHQLYYGEVLAEIDTLNGSQFQTVTWTEVDERTISCHSVAVVPTGLAWPLCTRCRSDALKAVTRVIEVLGPWIRVQDDLEASFDGLRQRVGRKG